MAAYRLLLVLFAAFSLLIFACNDNDDGGTGPTRSSSESPAEETATPERSAGGEKSSTPVETSEDEETPAATGPTRRPAPEGTPAVAPPNAADFLGQFADKTIEFEECQYNPATALTDCHGRGLYSLDPIPPGQDITCQIGIVDDKPELINCTSQQPRTSIYYDIVNG